MRRGPRPKSYLRTGRDCVALGDAAGLQGVSYLAQMALETADRGNGCSQGYRPRGQPVRATEFRGQAERQPGRELTALYPAINIQVTPKQISSTKADGMPIIAAPNRSPLKIIQERPIAKMAASRPAPATNWMNAGIGVR